MRLRCLLIDDEPPALNVLTKYVSAITGLEIVGQCGNAIEALDILQKRAVDVIFLDIKMPRLIGTDFLRNLAHPPKVIFVTAYREYAVDGFELDAVDYLVKPVSFERFFKAVTKLNRMAGREPDSINETEVAKSPGFVYLKVDKEMQKVYIKEILYIESWKDYVKVFLSNRKFLLVKQSITAMENLLSEHKFIRIHRSYIVSMDQVSGYHSMGVKVQGQELPIGRLYKQSVMERLIE